MKRLSAMECIRIEVFDRSRNEVILAHINNRNLYVYGRPVKVYTECDNCDSWLAVTYNGKKEIPRDALEEVKKAILNCFDKSVHIFFIYNDYINDASAMRIEPTIRDIRPYLAANRPGYRLWPPLIDEQTLDE